MANEFRVKNGIITGGDITPDADDSYDLGSSTAAFQDLFLEGDVILTDAGTVKTNAGDLTLQSASDLVITATNVGIGTTSPAVPFHVSKTLTGNDATTLVGAEVFRLDTIDDGSSSGGPGFSIRLESTNDHNSPNYEKVIMGDGGSMRVKNIHGNYGFSEWWLAGNADGKKPIMSLTNGGSTSAGQAQDGILQLYSTTDAWAVNTFSPTNNTTKVKLDAGGDSYFTGGDVGIGTTSPSSILHVKEASTINSVANSARMIVAANGGDSYIHLMESTDGHNIRHTASDNSLRFRSTLAGSDLMTLTSAGRLGIGTTEPDSQLDVRGPAGSPGTLTLSTDELTVVDGDKLGRIDFVAPNESDGTDSNLVSASIWAEADDTFAADNNETELVFATGASEAAAERMRLTSDGKLGIGTSTPSRALDVNGDIRVRGNNILDNGGSSAITFDGSGNTSIDGTLTVDDISISGSTITDSGDFTIDSGGDISLDADGADVILKDAGSEFVRFTSDSGSGGGLSASIAAATVTGTDTGGNSLVIKGGNATGDSLPGSILFQLHEKSGSSGSSSTSLGTGEATAMSISNGGTVTVGIGNNSPTASTASTTVLDIRGPVGQPGILTLSTKEADLVDGNTVGGIEFHAPLQSAGGDANLLLASITAEADATHSSTVNTTDLVFKTATSTAAAEAMRIKGNTAIETQSDFTVGGNLTVNGTTTTFNVTNTLIDDNLLELNSGATSNANDSGIIIERGSTGDNAIIIWDESEDKFAVGTTTATADTTGNITYTTAGLIANITGNITGDITGSSGSCTGNAATATTATNVVVTDNESTNENNAIIFTAGGDVDGSTSIGLESDGNLTYNPSTGTVTATGFSGNLTGTLQTAAQTNITSLGTLTSLTGGTGDLVWDTDTLFVDTSADRVGVNTASPEGELHVAGSAIVDYALAHGGESGSNRIIFTTGTQSFQTGGTDRMVIASSGAVSVAGAFSAATKSFDIEHPTKEGKRLHHGSLEGPEHGVYHRGVGSSRVVDLPDYWTGLVDEDSITVQLTPKGQFQSLYVSKIEGNRVYVDSDHGEPLDFYFNVYGERKDVDKLVVEY